MKKRLILTIIFIAYCAVLIKVMVFKDMPTLRIGSLMLNFSGTDGGNPANFVPFKTILAYLLGNQGLIIAGINLVGNIILLIPIGLLIAFVCRSITWKKALALAIAAGLAIEILQTVLQVGIFDVDDVILNALGVMIGYWVLVTVMKWVQSKSYKKIVASAIIVISGVAAFYGFVVYPISHQSVHSGQGITSQTGDLCQGTGGTGQVVSLGGHTIIIERNDASRQTIRLTDQTIIRNSAGSTSESDLQRGDRVTVVIDDSETASAVLVCTTSSPKGN